MIESVSGRFAGVIEVDGISASSIFESKVIGNAYDAKSAGF